jgi:tetratricopeptide (TPR) repeat protein
MQAAALAIFRTVGDRYGEAWTLAEIGVVRRNTADHSEAARFAERALEIYQELGDRSSVAYSQIQLGAVLQETQEYDRAASLHEEALATFREFADRHGQTEVLNYRGSLLQRMGEIAAARDSYRLGLEVAREVGNPMEEAKALVGIGRCSIALGEPGSDSVAEAIEILRRVGAVAALRVFDAELRSPDDRQQI